MGLAKAYAECFVSVHGVENVFGVPLGLVAQNPRRQLDRIFHADASVAEISPGSREQLRGGRAVHVNVIDIGHVELHEPQ